MTDSPPTPTDRSDKWREGYSSGRKEVLRDDDASNVARLRRMGMEELSRDSRIVEIGAGDGNVCATLATMGFGRVVGIEPQAPLVEGARRRDLVVASAVTLPMGPASVDVVLFMDVLHHLEPHELDEALRETHRVLRPDGRLLLHEPARTAVRRVLTVLLMSPLSRLTSFSRHKRAMVEEEYDVLNRWLADEAGLADRVRRAGFTLEDSFRGTMHRTDRYRPG